MLEYVREESCLLAIFCWAMVDACGAEGCYPLGAKFDLFEVDELVVEFFDFEIPENEFLAQVFDKVDHLLRFSGLKLKFSLGKVFYLLSEDLEFFLGEVSFLLDFLEFLIVPLMFLSELAFDIDQLFVEEVYLILLIKPVLVDDLGIFKLF